MGADKGPHRSVLLVCPGSPLENLRGDGMGRGFANLLGVLLWPSVWFLLVLTRLCHSVWVKLGSSQQRWVTARVTFIPPSKAECLLSLAVKERYFMWAMRALSSLMRQGNIDP